MPKIYFKDNKTLEEMYKDLKDKGYNPKWIKKDGKEVSE